MEDREHCEDDLITEVMASIGWQNSFVPLATEENKKLFAGLKFLGTTKLERIGAVEVQEKEALRVRELFNSADNEFDQRLKLLTAHKSQYSTEHHLFKLAEHEESKFKQLIKETDKELKELSTHEENLKSKLHVLQRFCTIFSSFSLVSLI